MNVNENIPDGTLIDLASNESEQLEYKLHIIDELSFEQQLSSFANTEGGIIVVGFDERKREVVGFSRRDKHIVEDSFNQLVNPPQYTIKEYTVAEDKPSLLIIYICKNEQGLSLVRDGTAFKREGSRTKRMSAEEISQKMTISTLSQILERVQEIDEVVRGVQGNVKKGALPTWLSVIIGIIGVIVGVVIAR